jgi:hypothetical protein
MKRTHTRPFIADPASLPLAQQRLLRPFAARAAAAQAAIFNAILIDKAPKPLACGVDKLWLFDKRCNVVLFIM